MTAPILIDTHAHVNFSEYDTDRDEVMRRAFNSGVKKILHACCSVHEISTLLTLSRKFSPEQGYSDLYMAVGVHPTEFHSWDDDSESAIVEVLDRELVLADNKIRAVGETGLDYYHCTTAPERNKQQEIFRLQIEIAKKFSLPLIIHTRDAEEDTLAILQECFSETNSDRNGTIHCFTGTYEFARACIELGFFISWSGIITFKNSEDLRKVAEKLPLERTLVETDCPFLAPQARRGKRNEPEYVNYVAKKLAELKGISKEEIMRITTRNAEYLFNI